MLQLKNITKNYLSGDNEVQSGWNICRPLRLSLSLQQWYRWWKSFCEKLLHCKPFEIRNHINLKSLKTTSYCARRILIMKRQ